MPTPRPETSVTSSAVEKPAMQLIRTRYRHWVEGKAARPAAKQAINFAIIFLSVNIKKAEPGCPRNLGFSLNKQTTLGRTRVESNKPEGEPGARPHIRKGPIQSRRPLLSARERG